MVLVRHCETESNAAGVVLGSSDEPLSSRGIFQAELVGEYVNRNFGIDRVLSSDLARCVDTARRIDAPMSTSLLLRELDFGEWEGRKWSELGLDYVETAEKVRRLRVADPNFSAPGGELLSSLSERVERLIAEEGLRESEQTFAVVAHAGVLRVLATSMLKWPIAASGSLTMFVGSISSIFTRHDIPRLDLLNYFDHLAPSYTES